jgi:class 3 adenylate cyclase
MPTPPHTGILSPDHAHLVLGVLTMGIGGIFFLTDRGSRSSRPVALCLSLIGVALLLDRQGGGRFHLLTVALLASLDSLSILAGVEWGRRIGQTAAGRLQIAANWLFRVAQLMVLLYWLLSLLYVAIFPQQAGTLAPGVVRVHVIEIAVLAPILGAGMICAAIAIGLLLLARIDKAEAIRLRVLVFASPFLLAGLVVQEALVPFVLSVGLLIFLFGSVRYLMVQGQRGQFMSQFLSPQVARLVRTEGMERTLKRRRQDISIVVCDLRGFTAYAREEESDTVVRVLERYYEVVGQVAAAHRATIKDHAGDGVLILVGAPLPLKDHARRAVMLALELMRLWNEERRQLPPQLGLGIGIATGPVTVGAIHGAGRLEYVAVGTPVNLAARLCSRAEDGEILVDQRTREAVAADGRTVAATHTPELLKGFTEPVPVYSLTAADATAASAA